MLWPTLPSLQEGDKGGRRILGFSTPRGARQLNAGMVSVATVGRVYVEAGQPPRTRRGRTEEWRLSSGEANHSQPFTISAALPTWPVEEPTDSFTLFFYSMMPTPTATGRG